MAGPKSMHDLRTFRSVGTRAMPASEGAVYLQLHRLAGEKLRLEREMESWLRKKEQIERRLTEIEQQMGQLRQSGSRVVVVESPGQPATKTWRQIVVEY